MDTAIVESVVKEFVAAKKLFTSVNIANHIKKEKKTWVKNSEIAQWLRQNFFVSINDDGDYDKTTIDVCNDTAQATLYHPCFTTPSSYTDTNLQAITPDEFKQMHGFDPFTGQSIHPAATVTTSKSLSFSQPVTTTVEPAIIREIARIHVPARMISAIGLKPGDLVQTSKFITAVVVPANLKVHKDGRLSLPRECIKFNGKSIGTRPVKVFVRDNRIGFESISGKS